MSDPNRPLWQVMRQADSSAASDYRSPEARMIRAIAGEIEQRRSLLEPGYNLTADEILAWLHAEADRAEAGDAAD